MADSGRRSQEADVFAIWRTLIPLPLSLSFLRQEKRDGERVPKSWKQETMCGQEMFSLSTGTGDEGRPSQTTRDHDDDDFEKKNFELTTTRSQERVGLTKNCPKDKTRDTVKKNSTLLLLRRTIFDSFLSAQIRTSSSSLSLTLSLLSFHCYSLIHTQTFTLSITGISFVSDVEMSHSLCSRLRQPIPVLPHSLISHFRVITLTPPDIRSVRK